jgi:hypothetical protein
VRAGRRLQGLVTALAAATLFAAPVASASPRWFINYALAGASRQNVVAVGSLTMDNKLFGEWKCRVLAGLTVGNESEKGVAAIDGWEPFDCSAKECSGAAYASAESPPVLEEPENAKSEKTERPLRESRYGPPEGKPNLPWPAELIADEVGKSALKMRKMKLWLICPSETFEPEFTGYIEPPVVNGAGSGLSPTHLLFEGKGGHTSWLNGTWLGGIENEETELFFSGELTVLGTGQELITAE